MKKAGRRHNLSKDEDEKPPIATVQVEGQTYGQVILVTSSNNNKIAFQKHKDMLRYSYIHSYMPGASLRNSAHGKGHEEGGLAYAKA